MPKFAAQRFFALRMLIHFLRNAMRKELRGFLRTELDCFLYILSNVIDHVILVPFGTCLPTVAMTAFPFESFAKSIMPFDSKPTIVRGFKLNTKIPCLPRSSS